VGGWQHNLFQFILIFFTDALLDRG
jgi:predicted histidine transporter YuiF (NhaC family)